MQLWERQALFAQNVAQLILYINSHNHKVTFGETFRTPEQALLDAKEGKGIINSLHCKRLAVDLNLFDNAGTYIGNYEVYKPYGDYWKTLHVLNRWGGDFTKLKDGNHFEMQENP